MSGPASLSGNAPALAIDAPPPRTLSEHRALRVSTLFLLYVAQGLPLGLINFALPAWLAQNGASAAAIGGVLAMANLPWTFKLAYGVVMDRYAFLPMGRRRPWIIFGQFALVAALAAMAITNPAVQNVALLASFAFALGMGSAVQDVAVDGLAADILPESEIDRVTGVMFGGQMAGMALGTGIAGTLIAYRGLPAAALALAAILLAILVLVLVVRERPGERLLPWTQGEACRRNLDIHVSGLWPIIRTVFAALSTRQLLLLIAGLILASLGPGILLGLQPMFASTLLGWEKDFYSSWVSQAQLLAGLPAALLTGLAAARWGARRAFILYALAMAVFGLVMLALQASWSSPALFIGGIFLIEGLRAMRVVSAGALGMRLCTPAIAATQFAVLMALLNLGQVLGGLALGWLDGLGGLPAMFVAIAVSSVIGAAFATAAKVGR